MSEVTIIGVDLAKRVFQLHGARGDGSATAGAGGTTVVNTPIVTFANAVAQVGMPQANFTAQLLGLGGATADSYNRVSVNTPALLLNNAGAGIEATVNKAAAGNDAAFAFKTGFSAGADRAARK